MSSRAFPVAFSLQIQVLYVVSHEGCRQTGLFWRRKSMGRLVGKRFLEPREKEQKSESTKPDSQGERERMNSAHQFWDFLYLSALAPTSSYLNM